jgi:signal peptidase
MEPALMTGDAIVTQVVRPSDLRVGEVVTFVDTTRGSVLVTHRVTEVRHDAGMYTFATRGDKNTGEERWTVPGDGSVGRLALRVPQLGFIVAWMSMPGIRAVLLGLPMLLVAATMMRRIWS